MVDFFKNVPILEKLTHTIDHIIFYEIPIIFEKTCAKSIRTWSLRRVNTKKSLFNLIYIWEPNKLCILSLSYSSGQV